jgi:hypothetical protein
VDDAELTLRTTEPLGRVLVSAAGFNNEVSVKPGENDNQTIVSLDELQPRDTTYVFLGIPPKRVAEVAVSPAQAGTTWTNAYQHLVQSVMVEGDQVDTKLYGVGAVLSEGTMQEASGSSSS